MNRLYYIIIFSIAISISTLFAIEQYIGEAYIYIFFTITSNTLLYFGFRKNAIFFDTFIGVFLWLGFWLKTTVRIIFLDSQFSEGLGGFIISHKVFDEALYISSVAFLALILASYLREKFFFRYKDKHEEETTGLFILYKNNRIYVLIFYVFMFLFVAYTNFDLGIYRRGEIIQTILPFGLNGIYKWLLLFGMSSFAALILKYEFSLKQKSVYFVPILTLIEAAITNISLFSRGMVLNAGALGVGILKNLFVNKIKIKTKFIFILSAVFIFLFLCSIVIVNSLRSSNINTNINTNIQGIKILFLDRWVGIEGVLAVSSSKSKSYKLFIDGLKEKYNENKTSFYDLNFINSSYINIDTTKHHYVTLPGFIAFFYYAGSVLFLFVAILLLGIFAGFLEYLSYRFSDNNLIFTALIAQVVAYRYSHFGYVPAQSYLLVFATILNIFLIYSLVKFSNMYYIYKGVLKKS